MQNSRPDEELLIDFVLGRCDQAAAEGVRRRLEQDRDFAALHENIAASFRALGKYDVDEPPANLVERTMARVRATRRSEALVAAEPLRRRMPFPAFSMRELAALAAAAILVIGIIIPSLRHARRRAQRSLCSANLGQIGTALNHYANENDDTLPSSPLAAGSWLPRPDQPRASNSAALFQLVRLAFAETDAFQCPATPARPFAVVAGMTRFPSAEAISYSYQYALGGPIRRSDPQLARVAEQMAIGVDSTPLFRNGVFRPEKVRSRVSENHPGGGQNVLYLLGHVRWVTHCEVGVNGNNIFLAEGIYNYTGNEAPTSKTDSFVLPNWP